MTVSRSWMTSPPDSCASPAPLPQLNVKILTEVASPLTLEFMDLRKLAVLNKHLLTTLSAITWSTLSFLTLREGVASSVSYGARSFPQFNLDHQLLLALSNSNLTKAMRNEDFSGNHTCKSVFNLGSKCFYCLRICVPWEGSEDGPKKLALAHTCGGLGWCSRPLGSGQAFCCPLGECAIHQ